MTDWISRLADVDRLPFKVGLWVAFVSGTLVFGSSSLLDNLGLGGLMLVHGHYVGGTFLASASLVAVNASAWILRHVTGRVASWRLSGAVVASLDEVDHAEKAVLREFIILGQHTIDLPVTDATVVGLLKKGVVRCESEYGRASLAGPLLPCSLHDAVRAIMTPERLGLPIGGLTEEDIARVRDARPPFAREVQRNRDLLRW